MTNKAKRKVNPRHRTLIRLILGIVIIGALIPLILKQFEPEHLYLVYESYDEETLAPNLYLYDATLGETMRQITHNTDSGTNVIFDTAENAPYLVYIYSGYEPNTSVIFVDLRTGQNRVILEAIHPINISLNPDGTYFAYQTQHKAESVTVTHLVSLQTGENRIVNEFHSQANDHSDFEPSWLNWSQNSLHILIDDIDISHDFVVIDYVLDEYIEQYRYDINTYYDMFMPVLSPDGSLVSYLDLVNDEPALIIRNVNPIRSETQNNEDFTTFRSFTCPIPLVWLPNNRDLLIDLDFDLSCDKRQFALLNSETGEWFPIVDDMNYGNFDNGFSLRPQLNFEGLYLLYIRSDRRCESLCPTPVILNIETGEETFIPMTFIDDASWVRIP